MTQSLFLGIAGVQIQIQFQNPHTRLAKKPKLPVQSMFFNQPANLCFTHSALSRYPGNLKFRRRRRDFRVEART